MIYADYDFYKNEFFGQTIEEADFPRLALRGSQYLDYITQGKAAKVAAVGLGVGDTETALKMACCALAEQYQIIDAAKALAARSLTAGAAGDSEVQSETVGSWSKSYRSSGDSAQAAAQAAKAAEEELPIIAQKHLAHTGLLYRGGRCCR